MVMKRVNAPNRADLLYKNLFDECHQDESFALIAAGLSGSIMNAKRMLSDAQLLIEAGRLSSAKFLLTTSREELAKSYILVDTCRLDLIKHKSVLRRLCGAFYDHIAKHAYLEVLDFPKINCLSDAKSLWDIEVQRWWPSSSESGEPDMPHDTYFDREFPLYIDYVDYDRRWHVPADSDQNIYFTGLLGNSLVSKIEKLLEGWRVAHESNLCSPEVLKRLNDLFKKHYIPESTTKDELMRLYMEVGKDIALNEDIRLESFMSSPIVQWPLYRFV